MPKAAAGPGIKPGFFRFKRFFVRFFIHISEHEHIPVASSTTMAGISPFEKSSFTDVHPFFAANVFYFPDGKRAIVKNGGGKGCRSACFFQHFGKMFRFATTARCDHWNFDGTGDRFCQRQVKAVFYPVGINARQ